MPVRHRITICAAAALLAACHSFAAPRPATCAAIRPMPMAASPFERFELELASPALTGTFDGVIADTPAGFRLQLFPDVGGKVLDLEVVVATGDARGTSPDGPVDPRFAAVLAAMFAEVRARVGGERVLGERTAGDGGIEVQLVPAFGTDPVVARLDPGFAIASYSFDLGRVEFVLHADGRLAGPRFAGHLAIGAARH